ncbi:MAG: GntR family transcriptional regulator [Actinomycetia bacterium]|nr:GntR family transcriptional regulator [Actinomycetes bacterium]
MAHTDSITDELRGDILAGAFPPGERLVELQLTERYECGRAAVRSALVELTTEGLVAREANRGAMVRRISVGEAIQITEARAVLESLIATHAARHATEAELDDMGAIVDDMRAAVAADDSVTYSELNSSLHRLLRQASHHAIAAELVNNLHNRATNHQYRLALMPGRPEESLEQHAAIIDAVTSRDEQGAAEAMEKHLLSVVDVLSRWGDAPGGV